MLKYLPAIKGCMTPEWWIRYVASKFEGGNVLIFGLGNDSEFYHSMNPGHTVFIEQNDGWRKKFPSLDSFLYKYQTTVKGWQRWLYEEPPRIDLPIYDTEWDVVLIDAPTGQFDHQPGRTQSFYTASLLKPKWVFADDCHRPLERCLSDHFLGPATEVYDRHRFCVWKVGDTGLEPVTSSM